MAGSCEEKPMWRTLPSALRRAQIVEQAAAYDRVGVLGIVHAVEEAEVRVFEAERLRLPLKGAADGVQIARPAVGCAIVEGAEVHLHQRVPPAAPEGGSHGLDGGALGGGEVYVVDAGLQRRFHDFDGVLAGLVQRTGAQTDDADLFAAVRQISCIACDPLPENGRVEQSPRRRTRAARGAGIVSVCKNYNTFITNMQPFTARRRVFLHCRGDRPGASCADSA